MFNTMTSNHLFKHKIVLFSLSMSYQNILHCNAKLSIDFSNEKTVHHTTSHWKPGL